MAPTRTLPPVMFDLIGAPGQGLGVPMRELSTRGHKVLEQMIVGANDHAGALLGGSSGTRKIRFRIIWPGYEHVDLSRNINFITSDGTLTTRAQLGAQVCSMFARFIQKMPYELPGPGAGEWRGCSYNRLILVALWNVHEDTWMAEVLVDIRR